MWLSPKTVSIRRDATQARRRRVDTTMISLHISALTRDKRWPGEQLGTVPPAPVIIHFLRGHAPYTAAAISRFSTPESSASHPPVDLPPVAPNPNPKLPLGPGLISRAHDSAQVMGDMPLTPCWIWLPCKIRNGPISLPARGYMSMARPDMLMLRCRGWP